MTREERIHCHFDRTVRPPENAPGHNPVVAKADGWRTMVAGHASEHEPLKDRGPMSVAAIWIQPAGFVCQGPP
jgi:hypothetical protein